MPWLTLPSFAFCVFRFFFFPQWKKCWLQQVLQVEPLRYFVCNCPLTDSFQYFLTRWLHLGSDSFVCASQNCWKTVLWCDKAMVKGPICKTVDFWVSSSTSTLGWWPTRLKIPKCRHLMRLKKSLTTTLLSPLGNQQTNILDSKQPSWQWSSIFIPFSAWTYTVKKKKTEKHHSTLFTH